MLVSFEFITTACNTWNGRHSGEGKRYIKVFSFRNINKLNKEHMIVTGYFSYRWSDGWACSIDVKIVDAKEARQLRKISKGFMSYDWMIYSILKYGKILDDLQIADLERAKHNFEEVVI